MHILFVTGEYPPMTGGVGAYTEELATALAALGAQISVVTARDAGLRRRTSGVTVFPQHRRWRRRTMSRIGDLAEKIGADWVHVQYQTAAYGMNPAINMAPARWQSRPFSTAWTYHDLRFPYILPKIGDALRSRVNLMPLRSADRIVFTAEPDRETVIKARPDAVTIPIGSNISARPFSPQDRADRRRMRGYGPDDLVVGYFGFLNRSKGGLALVRTLAALAEVAQSARLLMIGEQVGASDPTNYAYFQEVTQLAQDLNVTDRMQWTGFQPDAEVSADLDACDVILLPYADGASLRRGSLMAALAQGCAIVTTAPHASLPELVDGRDLLYVPAAQDAQAALAVLHLTRDPALARHLRQNARDTSAQFAWETIARRHLALYEPELT